MDFIQANLIDPISMVLYTYVLLYLLIAAGIYFTIRTRFVQFRYFRRMLGQLFNSRLGDGGISSFQAFCIGLASRVGTGNIAGVAIALTVGGPGAIFWMWMVALIGMATALIEATLAQIFKVRAPDGTFRGGPACYISRGLGYRPGGVVFAALLVFTFGFAFNMVQANAISDVLNTTHEIEQQYTTMGLVLLAAPVLFGGVRRVAKVAGPEVFDPNAPSKMAGASLTQAAVSASLGTWTTWLMTILVFVFAFSSVLGNYVYAEVNLFFLGANQQAITIFRVLVLIAIGIGAVARLDAVWGIADISMGLMAIVNLVAIVLLGKWAFAVLRNYHLQASAGEDPVFIAEEARLPGPLDGDIWTHAERVLR